MTEKSAATPNVVRRTFTELREELKAITKKFGHGTMNIRELEEHIKAGFEKILLMTEPIARGEDEENDFSNRANVGAGKGPVPESNRPSNVERVTERTGT